MIVLLSMVVFFSLLFHHRFSVCASSVSCISFCSVKEATLPQQVGACFSPGEEPSARQRVEEQKRFVESLRQEIQAEQRRAERELEREQAYLQQQHTESENSLHFITYTRLFKIQAEILHRLKKRKKDDIPKVILIAISSAQNVLLSVFNQQSSSGF